ncbi:MAG: serine hydrolase domain-containing protein [Lapillicoccus sp.]
MADGLSRRTMLQGLAASALATGSMSVSAASASAAPNKPPPTDWAAFDRAVQLGFDRMRLVGTAVAVVSADRVLHTVTLGSRSLSPRRPVTEHTRFLVASVTKSMSAGLVATYVDQGVLGWDQPAVDVWSGFRAPTAELTRTLRVRDLLGMGTGIGAPPAIDFHQGEPTAAQHLKAVQTFDVIDRPGTTFFYNNTVYAVGSYLPLLATGVAPADLPAAYAEAMRDRVFRPAGMTESRIASDPRGLVDDYATGYGFDLRPRAAPLAYPPVGGVAPVGGVLTTMTDLASWARLQLRQGLSVTGNRVVSAANLAQCWVPGVELPVAGASGPDVVRWNYALGWFREELKDGSVVIHHGGNLDGFSCFVAFLPQQDLGLVVMNNMDSSVFANPYLLDVLLNQTLQLNLGQPAKALAYVDSYLERLAALGKQGTPLDRQALTPYLGHYEAAYELVLEGQQLQLRLGPRVMPLVPMPDGSYVIGHGPSVTTPVKLAKEADGTPHIELMGLETVRRTTG